MPIQWWVEYNVDMMSLNLSNIDVNKNYIEQVINKNWDLENDLDTFVKHLPYILVRINDVRVNRENVLNKFKDRNVLSTLLHVEEILKSIDKNCEDDYKSLTELSNYFKELCTQYNYV